MASSETILRELFSYAGVQVNGSNAWDIQVHKIGFRARAQQLYQIVMTRRAMPQPDCRAA